MGNRVMFLTMTLRRSVVLIRCRSFRRYLRVRPSVSAGMNGSDQAFQEGMNFVCPSVEPLCTITPNSYCLHYTAQRKVHYGRTLQRLPNFVSFDVR